MSTSMDAYGSTTNENTTNQGTKRMRGVEAQGISQPSARQALSSITNSQRIQPTRAAKQKDALCQIPQQNANSQGIFGASGFSVYVDEEQRQDFPTKEKKTRTLNPAVCDFKPSFPINAPIIEDSPSYGSPMVLDASMSQDSVLAAEDSHEEKTEDVLCAVEYQSEILKYLKEAEQRARPRPGYMKKQPDITDNMRCILVDWLVEVAEEYKLHRETLCLAVNYVDRFLSCMSVLRGKLQLVGCASMFLASKYEEIYPPDVGEFVYITDETYTKKQVLRMEHLILKVLSFDVSAPTVNVFGETFLKNIKADPKTAALAWYLMELSMVQLEPFVHFAPSVVAASAITLACHTLGKENMLRNIHSVTGYDITQLDECVQRLHTTFENAPSHPQQAVREKYKSPKFFQVSSIPAPPLNTAPKLMEL